MCAVTGRRSPSILAIVALLAAGCGASSPVATPGAASAEPSSSAPSTAPTPTFGVIETLPPTDPPPATPEPSHDACPVETPTDQPGIWLVSRVSQAHPVVEITRMARVSHPESALPLPQVERPPSLMSFVGGRRSYLELYYFDLEWPWGWSLTSLSAKLILGNRDPIHLDAELGTDSLGNVSGASVRIPDRDATGTLEVEVAWYDSCFVYEGSVTTPVRIYPESSVAGCPTGRTAAFDELGIAFDPPILVDGVAANILPWEFAGKVRDMAVIDPLPPYVGFTAETTTIAAETNATITVAYENPAIELRLTDSPKVVFFERDPLLRWLDGGWIHGDEPEAPVVFRSKLVARDDGTFTFTTPPDPGRYVAEVTFSYDAACTLGTAGFVIGMDVP
jgi:hypothetical protein